MHPSKEFVSATAALARSAPAEWAAFVREFEKLNEQLRANCVRAPREEIFRIQGHAQTTDALMELFENPAAKERAILDRRSQSQPVPQPRRTRQPGE